MCRLKAAITRWRFFARSEQHSPIPDREVQVKPAIWALPDAHRTPDPAPRPPVTGRTIATLAAGVARLIDIASGCGENPSDLGDSAVDRLEPSEHVTISVPGGDWAARAALAAAIQEFEHERDRTMRDKPGWLAEGYWRGHRVLSTCQSLAPATY